MASPGRQNVFCAAFFCIITLIPATDIVLEGIAANIASLLDTWWENPTIIEQLQSLERVRRASLPACTVVNPFSSRIFLYHWSLSSDMSILLGSLQIRPR